MLRLTSLLVAKFISLGSLTLSVGNLIGRFSPFLPCLRTWKYFRVLFYLSVILFVYLHLLPFCSWVKSWQNYLLVLSYDPLQTEILSMWETGINDEDFYLIFETIQTCGTGTVCVWADRSDMRKMIIATRSGIINTFWVERCTNYLTQRLFFCIQICRKYSRSSQAIKI